MKTFINLAFLLIIIALCLIPVVDIPGVKLEYAVIAPALLAALIPTIASLVTTGAQVGLQIDANNKAGKERQQYQNQLQGRVDDLNSWFESEYNKDFMNTDMAKSSIASLNRQADRNLDQMTNAASFGGMTQEGQIASRGKLNETYADAITKLLGYGTQYKNNVRSQYDYRLQSLYQPMDALQQQRIADWGTQTQNITNAGNSLNSVIGTVDWNKLLQQQPQTTTIS